MSALRFCVSRVISIGYRKTGDDFELRKEDGVIKDRRLKGLREKTFSQRGKQKQKRTLLLRFSIEVQTRASSSAGGVAADSGGAAGDAPSGAAAAATAPLRLPRLSRRRRCRGVSSVSLAASRRCPRRPSSSAAASALSGALQRGQKAGSRGPPSSAAWQERQVACPHGKTTASEGAMSASRQTGHSTGEEEEEEEEEAPPPW